MRYAQFRAAGYLIGSGVIESGCNTFCCPTSQTPWRSMELEGAILTAKARCAWLSRRWQELLAKRSLLPLAI